MKKTHHYDHHNTFWDSARHLQNNNSHCLKQFYDSLNDEYEYALKWKIHDTLSRLGSSENTFTQVYVYEPETIKLNTDHYFIEQYNRQRAPQKKISRCLLASWNLDQNLGRIRNRRRHCSWTDTFFFSLILITIKNNSQIFLVFINYSFSSNPDPILMV